MFSKREKRFIALSIIISALLAAINVFAQESGSEVLPGTAESVQSADSVKIAVEEKISFYQSELRTNTEAIQTLEKELEQRKVLNERLNGAIAACREILNSLPDEASAKSGLQSDSPQ